mgnify:CR=1 FL=1
MKRTWEDRLFDAVNYTLLTLLAITMLYPFYYTVVCSFNDGMDLMRGGVYLWPRKFTLANYAEFLSDESWQIAFVVSALRTVIGTAATMLFTCLFSYGLSRKNLMFRKGYRFLVVFTMYFSGGIIPFYILLRNLNLLNTFWVYIAPSLLSSFFAIIGINFFSNIPESMLEAARIDGSSEIGVFWRIVIPTSVPFLATLGLFTAVGQWNSWLDSAYYVRDNSLRTLSYKMMSIINNTVSASSVSSGSSSSTAQSTTSFTIQATAMVISMLPIICVYPFLQKYFVQGMMLGSVKE